MDVLQQAITQVEHKPLKMTFSPSRPLSHDRSLSASESSGPVNDQNHRRSSSLQHGTSADTSVALISPKAGNRVSPLSTRTADTMVLYNSTPVSPQPPPKSVTFRVFYRDDPEATPGNEMKVQIYPHDSTDSIVTTIKNFYSVTGNMSIEDEDGNILIARYENFRPQMNVIIKTFKPQPPCHAAMPHGGSLACSIPGHSAACSAAMSRPCSQSPEGTSNAAQPRATGCSASSAAPGNADCATYGDAAQAMAKPKNQLRSTDISSENILSGNRRKRAKFESSELPLFAPPQMPANPSQHSQSPIRRADHMHRPSLPIMPGTSYAMQSPQDHGGFPTPYNFTPGDGPRVRNSLSGPIGSHAVMPTPDSTINGIVSEEDRDVAYSLVNMSKGDAEVGRAGSSLARRPEHASSANQASSDGEDLQPGRSQSVTQLAGSLYSGSVVNQDGTPNFVALNSAATKVQKPSAVGKPKTQKSRLNSIAKPKVSKPKAARSASVSAKPKKINGAAVPVTMMSPAPLASTQKIAGVSQPEDEDITDLSAKPRCQRCRKSKKGCDRARPCARCRDAGLSADQCISEDEGNGRKGRYGRHMGVPIRKDELHVPQPTLLPAAPIEASSVPTAMSMSPTDKSKKRKR